MAIEKLAKDTRCSECGAVLKRGTRAKVYRKADGSILVFGFDCHGGRGGKKSSAQNGDASSPAPAVPPVVVETLAEALNRIERALWTIVALLQKAHGVLPTETEVKAVQEAAEEKKEAEEGEPLTQQDWARFWVTAKRLGFTREQLHQIFEVESLKEVIKTRQDLEDAINLLKQVSGL